MSNLDRTVVQEVAEKIDAMGFGEEGVHIGENIDAGNPTISSSGSEGDIALVSLINVG